MRILCLGRVEILAPHRTLFVPACVLAAMCWCAFSIFVCLKNINAPSLVCCLCVSSFESDFTAWLIYRSFCRQTYTNTNHSQKNRWRRCDALTALAASDDVDDDDASTTTSDFMYFVLCLAYSVADVCLCVYYVYELYSVWVYVQTNPTQIV